MTTATFTTYTADQLFDQAAAYFEAWAGNEYADTTPDRTEGRVGMFTPTEAIDVWVEVDEYGTTASFTWKITSQDPDEALAEGKITGIQFSGDLDDNGTDEAFAQAFDDYLVPDWDSVKRDIDAQA